MSIGKKQIATFANRVKTLVPSYNQTHHPQKEEITITRTSVEEGVYAPFSQNSNLEGMYIKAHTINDGREDYALNQLVAIEDLEYRFLTPEGSSPFNNCVDNSNSAKTIEKGGRYEATLTPKAGFSKVPAGHLEMLIDANTWETVQGQTWSRSNSIGITVDPVLGNLRFVLENGEDCIYNLTLNKRVDGVQQSSIVLEKTCSDQINVDSLHTEAQFDEQGLTYKNVKESDGTTVITGTTTFCENTTLYIDYDSEVTPTTHIIDTSGVNTECVNVSISPANPYPIPNGLSRTLIFSPKSGKTIGSGQITMGNTVIDSWDEDRTEEFEVLVNNITADVIVTIGCGSTPDPRYTVNLEWRIQDDPSAEPLAVKEFTEVVNTLINPASYKTYDGVNVESLGYTITSMSPSESFNLTGDTTITYYCTKKRTITYNNINIGGCVSSTNDTTEVLYGDSYSTTLILDTENYSSAVIYVNDVEETTLNSNYSRHDINISPVTDNVIISATCEGGSKYTVYFIGDDHITILGDDHELCNAGGTVEKSITIESDYKYDKHTVLGSAEVIYNNNTITVSNVESDVIVRIYSKKGNHEIDYNAISDSGCVESSNTATSIEDGGNYTTTLNLVEGYSSEILVTVGQEPISPIIELTPEHPNYTLTINNVQDDITFTVTCTPLLIELTFKYVDNETGTEIDEDYEHQSIPKGSRYCDSDIPSEIKKSIDGYTYENSSLPSDCSTFNENATIYLYYSAESSCTPTCGNITNFKILYPGTDTAYLISSGYAPTTDPEALINALKENVFIICKIDNIIRKGSAEYFGWDIILDDNVQPSPNIQTGTLIDCKCESHLFYFYYTDDNPSIEILSGCFDMVNDNHLGTEFNVYYNGAIVDDENLTISYDYHIDSDYDYDEKYVTITAIVDIPGLEPVSVSKNMNVCPYFNVNLRTLSENVSITGDTEDNPYCWYPWYGSTSKFTIDAPDDLTIRGLYIRMNDYESSLNYISSTYSTLTNNSGHSNFSESIINNPYLQTIAFNDGKGGSITVETEDQGKTWTVTFNDIRGDITIQPDPAACLNQITVSFYKDELSSENLLDTKQYYAYANCSLSGDIANVFLCPEGYAYDSSYYVENNTSTSTRWVSCDHSEYQILFKPICKLTVECYVDEDLVNTKEYNNTRQQNSVYIPLDTPNYSNYVIDYAESDNYPSESFNISNDRKTATLKDSNLFSCNEIVRLHLKPNDLPITLYTYYDNVRFKIITDDLDNLPILNEGENLSYPRHWTIIGDHYRYKSNGTTECFELDVQLLKTIETNVRAELSSDSNIPIAYQFENLRIKNVEIEGDNVQPEQVNFIFTKNGSFILPSRLHVEEYASWTPIIYGQIDE